MGRIKLSNKEEDLVTSMKEKVDLWEGKAKNNSRQGEKVNSLVAGEQDRAFQREKSEERSTPLWGAFPRKMNHVFSAKKKIETERR